MALKMLAARWFTVPTGLFLALIALIVAAAVVFSNFPFHRREPPHPNP